MVYIKIKNIKNLLRSGFNFNFDVNLLIFGILKFYWNFKLFCIKKKVLYKQNYYTL